MKPSPTYVHFSTWVFAALLEIVLLGLTLTVVTNKHTVPKAGHPEVPFRFRYNADEWEIGEVVFDILRILLIGALIAFYVLFLVVARIKKEKAHAEETTGLLSGQQTPNGFPNGAANGHGYGTHASAGKHGHGHGHGEEDQPSWVRPTQIPSRTWWEYIRGYHIFLPYLWPSRNRRLQMVVVVCVLIVIVQRGLNLLVPYQVGLITNDLSGENGEVKMPWGAIVLYVVYRFLQGNNGILGAARAVLWIPVGQYSYRELSIASFEHVHSLSLDFHLGKKTGEVLSAMGKGSSINNFLEQVTFQVVPIIVDMFVAVGYFLIAYDSYYALVVAVIVFWYIYLTIRMAQWRAEIRRVMVNADREQDAVK